MYQKENTGLEGLSTWQLMNKTYEMLNVESKSLVGLVKSKVTNQVKSESAYKAQVLKISGKIKTVIVFLESLLVEGDELSSNLGSLYDWYLTNLNKMLDDSATPKERQEAAKNMIKQSEGFLDIWAGLKNAA